MSEQILSVTVNAFRGVPGEFVVSCPDGRSLACFGDNATGKSTIADALEWYFTGRIELLSHEGRQHAIRCLSAPEDQPTFVRVETTGDLGGEVVHPENPPSAARLVGTRETFLLRGRTLADFVNKRKAEKWRALTEILGLDAVDSLRLDLQRVRNQLREAAKESAQELQACSRELQTRVTEVRGDTILAALQAACLKAEVQAPSSLQQAVAPEWARSLVNQDPAQAQAMKRKGLSSEAENIPESAFDTSALAQWNDFLKSADSGINLQIDFLQTARALLKDSPDTGVCPLCGQTVDDSSLPGQVERTLVALQGASEELGRVEDGVRQLVDQVGIHESRRASLARRARQADVGISDPPVSLALEMQDALSGRAPIDPDVIASHGRALSRWDDDLRKALASGPIALVSSRDSLLVDLGVFAGEVRNWENARQRAESAERAYDLADQLLTGYQERQHEYFAAILDRISGRVTDIYERLHPEEGLHGVGVEPWGDKGVELAVDFHGTRQRPPHGVLSESHLNSLAISLFLAMAETFNEQLRFLVLDDVVNSFDVDHRGALSELLAHEFQDWQLIVLTHDSQFYNHLIKRAPSWIKREFTSWTYEEGPRTTDYATGGMLEKAQNALRKDDASGAAMKGRRALEELLQEICEGLHAPLAFRRGAGNDRRMSAELFSGLRRGLKDVSRPFLREIGPLLTDLEADLDAALNVESHAGRGRSGSAEIRAALERVESLDARWTCPACKTRVWHAGIPTSLRCRCGNLQFPPSTGEATTEQGDSPVGKKR